MEKAKYEFVYNASTDDGSSGSPIFIKGTTKVIGIHKAGSGNEEIKINYGDFIWPIFCYFKNFQKNIITTQNNNNNLNNVSNETIKAKNMLNSDNNIYSIIVQI